METTTEKSQSFITLCKSLDADHTEIPEIISFEDACKVLQIEDNLPEVSMLPEKHQKAIVAHYKLVIIAQALNQNWVPNWKDFDEYKWYPWFEMAGSGPGSGFGYYYYSGYYHSYAHSGSRLCFRTKTLAKYAGKQFQNIYEDYFLI